MPKLGDPSEYRLKIFSDHGYHRRVCKICQTPFWTKGPWEICNDIPCTDYRFFDIPLKIKNLSYEETVNLFLRFFEERGHKIINPAPVVARWREDLYLTIASIVVFQPHVTSGKVPPPANPLVIAQPCIRLEDIDNIGLTFGRHMTSFTMGGHHAFNYPDKYVYWKDETVRYAEEFFVDTIGVPEEELTFKESWWEGGGNAGPSMEVTVGGLEVATLVFMQYETLENGYREIPMKIVDVGYGIERITWLTQKTPTAFHAVFGSNMVSRFFNKLGVSEPDKEFMYVASIYSGKIDPSDPKTIDSFIDRVSKELGRNRVDVEETFRQLVNVFSVLDHTKTLALMLGDGIVPSNTGEGYLARLVLRRIMRTLARLKTDVSLRELIMLQIERWGNTFKSIGRNQRYILDVIDFEEERYRENIKRAPVIIKRYSGGGLSLDDLIEIYDSHGIPPEIVSEISSSMGLKVDIPRNFYSLVASRHSRAPIKSKEKIDPFLREWVKKFPETRRLFHEDPMIKEFDAKILGIKGNIVVLDQTLFYPLGGGQASDQGYIIVDGEKYGVVDVKMIDNVIIHYLDRELSEEYIGSRIRGFIDWNRRYRIMRHHTATHVLLGALRRVLGEHVWQAGADKNEFRGRLDVTHYQLPSREEISKIEELVNRVIDERRKVIVRYLDRYEAENKYGLSIYQGGVPEDPIIRIVEIEDWDAQACFGTHLPHTGEIGGFKIINVSKIADGVIRFEYVAGSRVSEEATRYQNILREISSLIGGSADESLVSRAKTLIEEREATEKILSKYRAIWEKMISETLSRAETINNVKILLIKDPPEEDIAREYIKKLSRQDNIVSILLTNISRDSSRIEISLSANLLSKLDARELLSKIISRTGGRGGGKKDHATGSLNKNADNAEEIIREVVSEVLRV
ncbi:MAG: alanine--tRNA ligase [Sulfolobales archaeon]